MKMCAQSRLYPCHGPLRFITSHLFRARLCHTKNEVPGEEAAPLHSGQLSTTATFFAPADSLYIDSCLNLSATATSLQQQRPLKRVPNSQNNLDNGQF